MEIDPKALIAVLAGNATEDEADLVGRWRAESPENEAEFRRHEQIWAVLGKLSVDSRDVRSADMGRPRLSAARPRGGRTAMRAFSATLLAAAAVLIFFSTRNLRPDESFEPLASADVETGPDEIRTVQLRDGTVVRLGPASRLSVTDPRGPRDVFVEGQAYFVVPSGQPHPFLVHSRRGQVAVIGTRFEVSARGEQVQVLVVEGEVALEVDQERVTLTRGQSATAADLSPPAVDSVEDIYGATAWIGNFAAYERTPLGEIALEFRRRFGYEIEVLDPELAERTVSGTMRDQSIEDMAWAVCLAVEARCTVGPAGVRMEIEREAPAPPLEVSGSPGSGG